MAIANDYLFLKEKTPGWQSNYQPGDESQANARP
jgi:hypothetical protein